MNNSASRDETTILTGGGRDERPSMPTGTIGRTSGAGREDGAGEASSGAERHYWLVPIDSELRQ